MNTFSVKVKLFYPIFLGMLLVIVLLAYFNIYRSKQLLYDSIEKNLQQEVETVEKLFERERSLKLEKISLDLTIAKEIFSTVSKEKVEKTTHLIAENQENQLTDSIELKIWKFNENTDKIIQHIARLTGNTATIFQRFDKGFVRIATNVTKQNGQSARYTYIPNSSSVVQTILSKRDFIGRAFVVDDWYLTSYSPIIEQDSVVGMLYVGAPEKDFDKLNESIKKLKIGISGYFFAFDKNKRVVMGPDDLPKSIYSEIVEKLNNSEKNKESKRQNYESQQIISFKYFPAFDIYLAAGVNKDVETRESVHNIIQNSLLAGILITIFFGFFIVFVTTKRLQKLLIALQLSGQKLKSAKVALKRSQENLQTLFDHSSDEIFVTDKNANIIEVNNALCKTLKYSREELFKMKIHEIKSNKYKNVVDANRALTFEKGEAVFESEHVAKDGELVPVEIHSKVLDFDGETVIMSISRNIKERKELERKLLSVVIQTEERERERFSKDMHDGLGPLLSTIKLYVNELEDEELNKDEKGEYLKYLNELIDEAVTSTRTISNNLMPRVIHEYGLVKAIESFCEKLNKTNNLEIKFNSNGLEQNLDQIIQLNLFRIMSELINNTIKHARASKIEINLSKENDQITLLFKDNGIGFNVEQIMNNKRTGIGLKSIISRVKSINGVYKFSSNPNNGFEIEIKI